MAGTRNAGWRLQANPLIARNLAGNGYTTRQIANQVTIALNTSSKYVLILAGTNDVINDDFDKDNFLQDYKEMLDLFENSSSIPVVTLIPLTQYREINRRIEIANEEIFKLASTKNIKIIDINSVIAPSGSLLEQYTTDGIHLSEEAYAVYSQALKKALND